MIDMHHVDARHDGIHARLENWARWVRYRPQPWKMQPMFRLYKAPKQWESDLYIATPINSLEGHEIERAVSRLPDKHRTAIRWAYVFAKLHPNAVQRELAVTQDALAQLIKDGRDMLKNRLREGIAQSD